MEDATIICLAKSRKKGRFCIAGRRLEGGVAGAWVRPVSDLDGGAVSGWQSRCADGRQLEVLDIAAVPLQDHCPFDYQHENHLIDFSRRWQRLGRASWTLIQMAMDNTADDGFWRDYGQSSNGIGDQVPRSGCGELNGSLRLIQVNSLRLIVHSEASMFYPTRRAVRAEFEVNGSPFKLRVTDPWVERRCYSRDNASYEIGMAMICVSVGEMMAHGCAYRLVAAIITPRRCELQR